MPSAPLVSVYLPTHNRSACLVDAIDSVLAQTHSDFELLVVDDGSTDETPRILSTLARRDARIRVFRHGASQGAPTARNTAIAEARGRFITGIDDDDLMLPDRLAHLLNAWTGRHSFVCSAFWRERAGRRRKLNGRGREIGLSDLLHYNLVGNQVLTLTAHLRSIGGFDSGFWASQDYDMWVRLVRNFGDGLRISASDYVVRESLSDQRISRSERFYRGAVQFTDKYRSLMTVAQLRSQALLHKITAGEHLMLRDASECLAWASSGLFFKYWLKCQLTARR